jgi:hypothetical protein
MLQESNILTNWIELEGLLSGIMSRFQEKQNFCKSTSFLKFEITIDGYYDSK